MIGPRCYQPRRAVVAMKVEKPYVAVADWCGGEIIRRYGHGSSVVGINLEGPYGEKLFAPVGCYIAEDPIHDGYFTTYPGDEFEKHFVERERDGAQNS